MKKHYKFIVFIFLLLSSAKIYASGYTHDESLSIDRNKVPSGSNLHFSDIDISQTQNPVLGASPVGLTCESYMMLCSRAYDIYTAVGFNVTPVAFHIDELKRNVTETINNKEFTFNIDYQNVQYKLTFYNKDTGSIQHMTGSLGDSKQFRPNRGCQNLIYGCRYYESRTYLESGVISITVKLPSQIKGGTYPFSISLGDFGTAHYVTPTRLLSNRSTLYLKGSITLPDRCYLSLSDNEIKFNAIKTSDNNGWISQEKITLTSTCVGNDKSVTLDLKIQPSNGSSVTNNYLNLAKDSQGNPALGVAASFRDTKQCQSDYVYNTFSNLGTMVAAAAGSSYMRKNIYFNLCKYGIPTTGTHNASVNIVARWTQN
ncbi:hypothetical protein B6R14_004700 [Escherichia coli]|uniref:hypothetical protein n=3 Tax=Escherichia coli TaxID=562 RepID=UPI000DA4FABE|nr:hypothetical protein [Escherichia coli]EFA4527720.1 hypothetical protein [Escherichia coli]EFC4803450.1 hypothetical protein [Escherichia coli]EFH4305256.1 hypothetical protein [Escherichia coli]EFM7381284.1 hypothetical protein [Escherichia coli]EFM7760159.1 hypothetical protein [Escherichia coli]